jgi:hypothetical protein
MPEIDPDAFIPRQIRDVEELKIEILYLAGDAEAVSPMGAELLRAVARAVEPDGLQQHIDPQPARRKLLFPATPVS